METHNTNLSKKIFVYPHSNNMKMNPSKENPSDKEFSSGKRNFGHNVKKYLKQYSEVSSMQGFRYLSENRSTGEKIIWTAIILISFCLSFYMIWGMVLEFENSPIVVNMATEDTPIYEIPFPAVTFCMESKFPPQILDFSYDRIQMYIQHPEYGNKITQKENYTYNNLALLCNEVDSSYVTVEYGNKTVADDFYQVAFDCKPPSFRFTLCIFKDNTSDCSDLFFPIITDQGICYTFNSLSKAEIFRENVTIPDRMFYDIPSQKNFYGEYGYLEEAGLNTHPKRALLSGANNALEVAFTYSEEDSDLLCTKNLDGIRVLIHNPLDMPRLSKDYIRISNYKAAAISVQPNLIVTSKTVRKYNPETRKCYFRMEKTLKYFKFYTQSNCLTECFTDYVLTQCNCVSFYMPRDNKTAICGISNSACVKKAEISFKENQVKRKISGVINEDCDCKPTCTDLKYKVEVSQSDYTYGLLKKSEFDDDCGAYGCSSTRLSIYFKEETFTATERNELYGVFDMISNFGGLLGLFTGFSLMSLVELIYFFTVRIFYNKKLYKLWSGPDN